MTGDAEILIVYQKEPHAGQMAFGDVVQPESFEQRCVLAQRMKDEYELPMTVLVDTMEDQSRALFSDLPSPAFVIDAEGIIRAKFPWAEGDQIAAAVSAITGEPGGDLEINAPDRHLRSPSTGEQALGGGPTGGLLIFIPLALVALLVLRAAGSRP
ncbi:MAG: hypothetical protein WAO31_03790 [Rhodoluna sp.]